MAVHFLTWGQVRSFEEKGPPGMRGNAFIEFTNGEGQAYWTDALPSEDGTFTVAGTVFSGGVHYLTLARFLPNGDLDCSFQNQGVSKWTIPIDWEYLVKLEPLDDAKFIALFHPPDAGKGLSLARFYADGYLDASYGKEGIFHLPESLPSHFVTFKRQENGKILAGGYLESPEPECIIYRLLPDGEPDPSFSARVSSPGGQAFHLLSLAPYPDERVLVSAFQGEQLAVFRLLPDGQLDLSFGENGFAFHPVAGFRPYDLLLLPDGSWIALGAGSQSAEGWPIAAKGLPSGAPDTNFGLQGVLYSTEAFAAAAAGMLHPDGAWTIAGVAEMTGRTGYFILRRFLADGTPEEAFGAEGYLAPCFEEEYFQGTGIFIRGLADGRLLAGGGVNMKGALICLGPDGRPDPAFGKEGLVVSALGGGNPVDIDCCEILFQEDGKILAAGSIRKPFDSEILAIRMESDGAVDPSFVDHGYASVHLPHPVTGVDAVLQGDGKLVVGGKMSSRQNDYDNMDFAACRLNPDGSLDSTFGKKGLAVFDCGLFDELGALALQDDGKILLAGDMENPETGNRMLTVYRLHPNGKPDLAFGVDGLCAVEHLPRGSFAAIFQQGDGKILLLDAHPPWGFDIVRLLPNGIPDETFAENGVQNYFFPNAPATLQTLMAALTTGDGILVAGQMGNTVGMMQLNDRGKVDPSFGSGGIIYHSVPETAWELEVLSDGKFLLGGSGCSDFAPFNYFFGARFLPDGQPDTLFGHHGVLKTEMPAFSLLTTLLVKEDESVILGGKGYTSESDVYSDILLVRYLPELDAGHLCPAHQFPFIDVFPYPIRTQEFPLQYDLPKGSNVMVSLWSPQGKEIASLLDVCRPEGRFEEILSRPPGLPSGPYVIRVRTEEVEASIRVLFDP